MNKMKTKQLKEVAAVVVREGELKLGDPDFLLTLPGVGNYIRNSILCFSFGLPKPTLDTNMIRLISRVFSYETSKSRAREDNSLWEFAEMLVPNTHCREYNWGVLDFASEICTLKNPKCGKCNLYLICEFINRK
jgi:A/G-specific adenine glycosylase